MAEHIFYFETGLMLKAAFAGNEVKNLRQAGSILDIELVSRDNWIKCTGEEECVRRSELFLKTLQEFTARQGGGVLEQRDFEQICMACKNGSQDSLKQLWEERIVVGAKKKDILPRSPKQLEYIRAIREKDVVFGIGPAGTGKTYLAMAMAVSAFLKSEVRRIILTRPARESGENLGFLPGSLEEKILPYLRPLYDALYDMLSPEEVGDLLKSNIIEVAPLAFMRGRTLNKSFIILDEAQNTTSEQMLMFLTRMGYDSKCVITGDPSQNDLKSTENSGLLQAEQTLRQIPEIAFCKFSTADVVRNVLLEKIINAYTH